MGVGMTFVLIVLIICLCVIACVYMCYCSENEVKMFQNPKYDERIRKLEKQMEELKKE